MERSVDFVAILLEKNITLDRKSRYSASPFVLRAEELVKSEAEIENDFFSHVHSTFITAFSIANYGKYS